MCVKKVHAVFSRVLLIGWASVWLTALPLFHIHLPGVFEQSIGLAHTVFSVDLQGEYAAFDHTTAPDEFRLSILASNSPELGFVATPGEGKKRPLIQLISVLSLFFLPPLSGASVGQDPPLVASNSRWSPHVRWFRGPPSSVSL